MKREKSVRENRGRREGEIGGRGDRPGRRRGREEGRRKGKKEIECLIQIAARRGS